MESIYMIGKTVDEALSKALEQLNVTKDRVEVDIIEEGTKGLFNFIGSKSAKIKVTLKRDYIYEGKKFLIQVLNTMGIEAEVDIKEENDTVYINLIGSNMGTITVVNSD